MKDANHSTGCYTSGHFQPSASLVLTAGLHKTLSLFQIDGENNSLRQSIYLQRFPILTPHFYSKGRRIYHGWWKTLVLCFWCFGQKGHNDDNQLISFQGSNEYIPLLSKQWISNLPPSPTCTCGCVTFKHIFLQWSYSWASVRVNCWCILLKY